MFNINNLITRIRANDKGRDTPPSPSNRPSASSSEETDDKTAEGFLCPSCMENFSSPEDLQTHYENFHTDDEQHICPICKNRFPTSDQLQIHYTTTHTSGATVNNGDLKTLRQEVAELHTTLKEERWYSEELKKEVSKLSGTVGKESSEEFALFRHQIKALEESKSLLTSEVVLLRKQLGEAVEMHTSMKQQKELLEQKAANLASEKVSLEACVDEERSLRAAAESRMTEIQDSKSNLEAQLQQRPEADDVLVLRQELVQVQTLMDRMTRERETERDKLGQDNKELQARIQELREQLNKREEDLSKAPTTTEVQKLQKALGESSSELQTLRLAYEGQQLENEENFQKLKEYKQLLMEAESTVSQNEKNNQDMKQLQNTTEIELQETKKVLEETRQHFENLRTKTEELEQALLAKNSEILTQQQLLAGQQESATTEMVEKTQLLSEMKLNAEQLERSMSEKESRLKDMQKQLVSLQDQYQIQVTAADELKVQLWEVQSELEKEARSRKNGEEKLQEYTAEMSQQKETFQRFEKERTELYAKIEAGEGSNTAIQQLQLEKTNLLEKLSEQHKTTSQQAAEYTAKVEELHNSLQEMKMLLQNSTEKNSRLETTVKDTSLKLSSSQEKCKQMEFDLKDKIRSAVAAETEWSKEKLDLEGQVKNIQTILSTRSTEVNQANSMAKKLSEELSQCKETMKISASKLESEVQRGGLLQLKVQSLESETVELKKQLGQKIAAAEALTRKLDSSMEATTNIAENFNKKEAEFKEQLNNSENIKESLQKQVDELKGEKTFAEKAAQSLQNTITEKCQALTRATIDMRQDLLYVKTQHALLKDTFVDRNKLSSLGIDNIASEFVNISAKLQEKCILENSLNSEIRELQDAKLEHDNKVLQLQNTIEKYKSDIQLQADCNDALNNDNEAKEIQLRELNNLLKEAKSELNKSRETIREHEFALCELQQKFDSAIARHAEYETKLAEQQNKHGIMTTAYKKVVNDFQESKNVGDALRQNVQEKNQVIAKLESQTKEMTVQKSSIETELFAAQKSLSDYEEKYSTLEMKFLDLQALLIQEKDNLGKKISDLESARELLIQQKLEIQNHLLSTEEELQKESSRHEQTREAAKNEAATLQQKVSEVVAKLTALQTAKNAIEQEAERVKARYEMQMGTLQENLATLRADLCTLQDAAQNQEKKNYELSENKLELEGKLENALDERRALLERCLSSESDCEKLKVSTMELRRKLDDALSALHELGRENQTLQIETAKHMGRKWTDDSEVTNCTGCQKLFSVTVRKHHCRQCLNIYCNQCSAKSATIPAYKKPVRVCDGCFTELASK